MSLCKYHQECSGCSEWETEYSEQLKKKSKTYSDILNSLQQNTAFESVSVAPYGLRDRLDFQIQSGRMGLYSKDHKHIIDLPVCLQLTENLQRSYQHIRQFQFPIDKGSFRLRVSPEAYTGLWLDFSNLDIKKLLDQKTLLQELLKIAYVEVGQRRKKLVQEHDQLKLRDPELRPWTRTWNQGKSIPLYSCVSHFSQVGDLANRALTQIISDYTDQAQAESLCEFGSGHGNLTLAVARPGRKILATDVEELPLQGLKKAAEENGFSSQIEILAGDFQQKMKVSFKEFDTILVNPPRSGLKAFLDPLATEAAKPRNFIYMSCYPQSFQIDARNLLNYGYRLKKSHIVDQFPQTEHFEILSWWQLY